MNLREGTRRLALLLGVVGAIGGCFVSCLELQQVLPQRALHNRFEQLAASDIVTMERKRIQARPDFIPDPPPGFTLDKATQVSPGVVLKPIPQHGRAKLSDAQPVDPNDWQTVQPQVDWSTFIHIPSEVNKGGVGTINWGTNYAVASIVTEDGQTLSPTPSPAAWQYLFIVLCPIFGFLIPWGAVRAIGWVGAGFTKSSG